MISRTYIIARMPEEAGVALDIAVETAPGTKTAPVGTGGAAASGANGVYYELRGRPIRFPVRFGQTGFVPRAALGWRASIYAFRDGVPQTEALHMILSQSIVGTDIGPTGFAVNALVEPGYGPTIRINNSQVYITQPLILHFDIMEAKDDDWNPIGSV